LEFKFIRLKNLKGVSLEVMDVVGKCFDFTRRNLQCSVKHSGATTPRKKLLGSIEKTFEIIIHT
jgi:hypothetical protein